MGGGGKSRGGGGGGSLLVALYFVFHGRLAIGYGLFFRLSFFAFYFPGLSVGALCFVMNGQRGMFPSWFPLLSPTNLQVLWRGWFVLCWMSG